MKKKTLSVFMLLALLLGIASSGTCVLPVFADTGTVIAWGYNEYGQTDVPAGLSGVTAISAGYYHSLALKSDGTVVAWGRNSYGQASVPAGMSGVIAIAAGGYHSLALKNDGTVVAWGDNNAYQSTVPAGLSDVTAIAAGVDYSLALKSDGTVVAWGWNANGQLNIPADLSGVTAIAAGDYHNLALKSDGTVVAWGRNVEGQANIPAGLSGVIAIAAGFDHNLALESDGTVIAWGNNNVGQINVPVGLSGVIAFAAGSGYSLALKSDGTVVAWGSDGFGKASPPSGLIGVTAISAGYLHSLAVGRVNHAPVAADDSYSMPEDWKLFVAPFAGVLRNDTDADGDLLTAALVSGPAYGTLNMSADGGFNYAPAANYAGMDSFTYRAYDGNVYSNTATVTITVNPSNDAPVSQDQSVATNQGTALDITLLAADVDNDPLTYTIVTGPANGTLSGTAPNITYTPNDGYFGSDSITFKANDGAADSNVATVSITIGQANTAPTANPGGPYLGAINTAISFDGSGSSDPDGDPLTYAWAFGDGGTSTEATPTHGYAAAGVYDVCLTVHDGTVDSPEACTLAVVYDPSAGFVTGGGWIDSPAGAYEPDPALAGQATFGFVSKYHKGATVPTGNTEFQFDVAGFSFDSETYEWLVVNQGGTNAQFKGSGTVNGGLDPNGNPFKFMIWAGDGTPDTFRIRIWWEGADGVENPIYDNGVEQAIGAGNIVIHTK